MRKLVVVLVALALLGCGGADGVSVEAPEPVDAATEMAQDAPGESKATDGSGEAEASPEASQDAAADEGEAEGGGEAGPDGSPDGDAVADAAPEADAPFCQTGMTQVAGYCVDNLEVSRAEYAAWLSTSPAVSGQESWCLFNKAFEPGAACMADPTVCVGDCSSHPQVCVDWCDAVAYCSAHGKRLCGGVNSAAPTPGHLADPADDQWQAACTVAGGVVYPYGMTYGEDTCNGVDHGKGTTVPSGSMLACKSTSPLVGIFDMSGNVAEWEFYHEYYDEPHPLSYASTRGGSFVSNQSALSCALHAMVPIATQSPTIGFRCCAP